MAEEILDIFADDFTYIGTASRTDVHKLGYWHQTFHCWIVSIEEEHVSILFQKRALVKKDFPGLLDITAAGHMLAGEKIEDGMREVEEELGIQMTFDELIPLGTIIDEIRVGEFLDREFCHVFIAFRDHSVDEYILQKEEVMGLFYINIDDVIDLLSDNQESVMADGFQIEDEGIKARATIKVTKQDLAPLHPNYYEQVLSQIKLLAQAKGK